MCDVQVPRNHLAKPSDFPSTVFEISDAEMIDGAIGPEDFAIGKEVSVFGRKFFVYVSQSRRLPLPLVADAVCASLK